MPDPRDTARRYMLDRISVGAIVAAGALVAGAIAFASVASLAVIHLGSGGGPVQPRAVQPPAIAAPTELQPSPERDIAALREQKGRLLETYDWVDADHRVARIPIERAMALLAQGARAAP